MPKMPMTVPGRRSVKANSVIKVSEQGSGKFHYAFQGPRAGQWDELEGVTLQEVWRKVLAILKVIPQTVVILPKYSLGPRTTAAAISDTPFVIYMEPHGQEVMSGFSAKELWDDYGKKLLSGAKLTPPESGRPAAGWEDKDVQLDNLLNGLREAAGDCLGRDSVTKGQKISSGHGSNGGRGTGYGVYGIAKQLQRGEGLSEASSPMGKKAYSSTKKGEWNIIVSKTGSKEWKVSVENPEGGGGGSTIKTSSASAAVDAAINRTNFRGAKKVWVIEAAFGNMDGKVDHWVNKAYWLDLGSKKKLGESDAHPMAEQLWGEQVRGDLLSESESDLPFQMLTKALKTTALPTSTGKTRKGASADEFMYMGTGKVEGYRVWMFKHRETRNYLYLVPNKNEIIIPKGGDFKKGFFDVRTPEQDAALLAWGRSPEGKKAAARYDKKQRSEDVHPMGEFFGMGEAVGKYDVTKGGALLAKEAVQAFKSVGGKSDAPYYHGGGYEISVDFGDAIKKPGDPQKESFVLMAKALKLLKGDKEKLSGTMGVSKHGVVLIASKNVDSKSGAWATGANARWVVWVMPPDRAAKMWPGLQGQVFEDTGSSMLGSLLEDLRSPMVIGEAKKGIPGTVENFITVLGSKLTQYDQRLSKGEMKRGGSPNIYRLGHFMGAVGRVRDSMKGLEQSSDKAALEKLKANISHYFTDFPPRKAVLKQIDQFLASGKLPSLI